MIRLRLDGPGSATLFVAQFSESATIVRSVYRRLRAHLSREQTRDVVVRLAIALGQLA